MTSYDQLQADAAAARDQAIAAGLTWTPLDDILATPPANWLIEGLIAAGSVNIIYGAPKVGKSLLILAMLKAASDGTEFLGKALAQMPTWLITEQSENSLAPQLRLLNIGGDADISVALWRHQEQYSSPEIFAEVLYREFIQSARPPAIVVIDTLASFVDLRDSNDYSQTRNQMSPLIEVAQRMGAMENTATALTHHSRKSTGEGSDAVLGSRAIAGIVDTLIQVNIVPRTDGQRKLSIQSRFGTSDIGEEIRIVLELPVGEYRLVNTGAELDEELLSIVDAGDNSPALIRDRLDQGEGDQTYSPQMVSRRLTAMVKDGKLIREGKGKSTRYNFPLQS